MLYFVQLFVHYFVIRFRVEVIYQRHVRQRIINHAPNFIAQKVSFILYFKEEKSFAIVMTHHIICSFNG